jgi:hypothetical protein
MRLGAFFAAIAPEIAATVQRATGADRVGDQFGAGQRSKR